MVKGWRKDWNVAEGASERDETTQEGGEDRFYERPYSSASLMARLAYIRIRVYSMRLLKLNYRIVSMHFLLYSYKASKCPCTRTRLHDTVKG